MDDDLKVCTACMTMFDGDAAAFVVEGGSGAYECPDCGSQETMSFEAWREEMADADDRYNNQRFD